MRVVAGEYRGIPLLTLKGDLTRPTSDKIKASFFQMVGPFFEGGRMLDAFSGSGAMAIEALSRGMDEAILVEKNPAACQVIESNLKKVKTRKGRLYRGDVRHLWTQLPGRFNLIYLDPPYRIADISGDLAAIRQANILKKEALVCYELASDRSVPDKVDGYELVVIKDYKATRIAFYRVNQS